VHTRAADGATDALNSCRPLTRRGAGCFGQSSNLLDIVQKIWAPLKKLITPLGAPSWLRAWTVVTQPSRPLYVLGALGTRICFCKCLPYIFIRSGLPLYSVGPHSPADSCRPPSADRSIVLHPLWDGRPTLNPKNQLKLCRNQWVTVDSKHLCIRCTVLVQISVLEGSVHDAQCVVPVQVQLESSGITV